MESNEDIARHYEPLKLGGKELDGLVPVKAQVKPNADVIYLDPIHSRRDGPNR